MKQRERERVKDKEIESFKRKAGHDLLFYKCLMLCNDSHRHWYWSMDIWRTASRKQHIQIRFLREFKIEINQVRNH